MTGLLGYKTFSKELIYESEKDATPFMKDCFWAIHSKRVFECLRCAMLQLFKELCLHPESIENRCSQLIRQKDFRCQL